MRKFYLQTGLYDMKRCAILYLLLFSLAFGNSVMAQQGNNWYFGDHAGLTFNTNPPTPLTNSALSTMEGCATISDGNGMLLFYTDGSFVYNRNHQIMPNGSGLYGHPSSSNSSIIVQQPGSDSLYYIFTVDAAEHNYAYGYRYSIVDMSLDGGLGDISVKNILLTAPCTEKIAAVKHANGTDAWIITKNYTGNGYKAFRLGCSGVDVNPVESFVGTSSNGSSAIRVGALKASPDSRKIATVQWYIGWELFNFDNTTGKLSDPLFITVNTSGSFNFGLEFSPDSKLIYVSCERAPYTLLQYKIDSHDPAIITASVNAVGGSLYPMGNMQLGPDNRLYIPNEEDSSPNIVTDPNQYGVACNYLYQAINLGYERFARRCLPAFYKDNISNSSFDFSATSSVDCGTVSFSATTTLPPPITWFWEFGDGSTATGQNVTHQYAGNGTYTVRLTVNNPNICGSKGKKSKIIELNPPTNFAHFGYSASCGNKSVQFSDSSFANTSNNGNWQWDFGDGQTSTIKNPLHTYADTGWFTVKLKVIFGGLCTRADSQTVVIRIEPQSPDRIFLGKDTVLCRGTTLLLNARKGFKNYLWQNGSTDSVFTVLQAGTYYVTAKNYCGNTFSDTIVVAVNDPDPIILGNDTSLCANQPLMFNIANTFVSYLWNTGNTTAIQSVTSAAVYWVAATNMYGCVSRDTIQILNIFPAPVLSLNKTQVICSNQNDVLDAGAGYHSYIWQNGSTASSIKIVNTGLYKLTVTNSGGCAASDSVLITKIATQPKLFLGRDTTICSDENITIVPQPLFKEYLWSNGTTVKSIIALPQMNYWLKVKDDNNCIGIDTIFVSAKDCGTRFYVPNSFTPNNDGLNDLFKPIVAGRIELYDFQVYNMYGQLIFRSTDSKKGWNGSFKSVQQNNGTYVWYCRYKAKNEVAQTAKGTVLLIR